MNKEWKLNMKNNVIVYGWYVIVCVKVKWVIDWLLELKEILEKLYIWK